MLSGKQHKAMRMKALMQGKPSLKITIKEKDPMAIMMAARSDKMASNKKAEAHAMGMGGESKGEPSNQMESMMVSSEEKAMIEKMRKGSGMSSDEDAAEEIA